ncbi:hypothetical protein HAX54_039189 [Datura stramonium]|uniref:Uncharacterized protein n=1 Tax=Datura stramonium TaxID=4076 RepID=A0ABS8VKW1_DATST|nr:hypothetical protein [Datura stramonium]
MDKPDVAPVVALIATSPSGQLPATVTAPDSDVRKELSSIKNDPCGARVKVGPPETYKGLCKVCTPVFKVVEIRALALG